jgi:hypothetical protein
MKITVTIESDEREAAAVHLAMISKMVAMGMGEASGYNEDDMTAWSVAVEADGWPHGDYHDEKGNLLHVHNDHVVHVTRANATAETENINVPVDEWIAEYGTLTYISGNTDAPKADS